MYINYREENKIIYTLRNYQESIVRKTFSTNKNMLLSLPTGSGKTVIADAIIKRYLYENPNSKVYFLVPDISLVEQSANNFGVENVDKIIGKNSKLTGKKVVVASKPTLFSVLNNKEEPDLIHKFVEDNSLIIIDEVHYSLEQSYDIVSKVNPLKVIGLTATPEREDGMSFMKGYENKNKFGLFDEYLQEESIPSLGDKGYLVKNIRYFTKPIDDIDDFKKYNNGLEMTGSEMRKVFDSHNLWGDPVNHYKEYGIDKYGKLRSTIGLAPDNKTAAILVEKFKDAGFNFELITGEDSIPVREEKLKALKDGRITGLVSSILLTKGIDVPNVSYMFSTRHIQSKSLFFQGWGRGMRPCEGKDDLIIMDHGYSISNFSEVGCPNPLQDYYYEWKYNGITAFEKERLKEKQQQEKQIINMIKQLDPIPCDLVEITNENTFERILNISAKIKKENETLKEKINKLYKELEEKNNEYNLLIKEREELKYNLNKAEEDNDNLNNEVLNFIETKNQLENRILELNTNITSIDNDRKILVNRIKELEEANKKEEAERKDEERNRNNMLTLAAFMKMCS